MGKKRVELANTMLQILAVSLLLIPAGIAEDFGRNPHPNHRHSLMSMKELTDHWIGMPKSPYVHYTASVTSSPTTTPVATSAPVRPKSTRPKKKTTTLHPNRRTDDDHKNRDRTRTDDDDYRSRDRTTTDYDYRNRDRSRTDDDHRARDRARNKDYPDFDYDYDGYEQPQYPRPTVARPPIVLSSASSPKTMYLNPSGSSSSMIFAGVPKVATYVVPSSKKYVVQRVKSQAMYVPPTVDPSLYAAGGDSGLRRIDPLDYNDNGDGGFLGPQNSFPPRAVMNKISQSGQQQPCHGPECHQHHKGLVRFYWRRVVYPPDRRGRRRRRPGQFRRPPRNRRRFRDGSRSPSDLTETYVPDHDDNDDDHDDGDDDTSRPYRDEDEDVEDNESSNRRQAWRPGKGYGHDLHEGSNYDNEDRMMYRDKRYANRRRLRNNYFNYKK